MTHSTVLVETKGRRFMWRELPPKQGVADFNVPMYNLNGGKGNTPQVLDLLSSGPLFSQVAMTGYPGGLTSLHSMAIAMKNCWTFQEAVLPSSCNETFLKVLIFCLLILSRLN